MVGSFPNWDRWSEWNGKYRDDVRAFVRGDPGKKPAFATRLAGSADLYNTNNRCAVRAGRGVMGSMRGVMGSMHVLADRNSTSSYIVVLSHILVSSHILCQQEAARQHQFCHRPRWVYAARPGVLQPKAQRRQRRRQSRRQVCVDHTSRSTHDATTPCMRTATTTSAGTVVLRVTQTTRASSG